MVQSYLPGGTNVTPSSRPQLASALYWCCPCWFSLCMSTVGHVWACPRPCSPSELFLGPSRVHIPNDISIGSAVFAGLTVLTDWQTDRPRYSICSNRPHLASAAMRPKNAVASFGYTGSNCLCILKLFTPCLKKTSHLWLAITLTHIYGFWYFLAEMLPIK